MDRQGIDDASRGELLRRAAMRHTDRRALAFPGYDVTYDELL